MYESKDNRDSVTQYLLFLPGLLCITSTDVAVLSGSTYPEKWYFSTNISGPYAVVTLILISMFTLSMDFAEVFRIMEQCQLEANLCTNRFDF